MAGEQIPLVVLAGADRRPTELPDEGKDKHPLSGYKGVDIRIGGRPMVENVVERLVSCGRFAPIYLVGPASAYREVHATVELVDSNGTFGENIEAGVSRVRAEHPGRPAGFTVCDILPDVETVRALMQGYDRLAPCDLWFPLIHTPKDRRDLGASAWKPTYRIVPEAGAPAVEVLPGHLVVTDLDALELDFVFRLFELAYKTRNRSIGYRRRVMVRGVLGNLLRQDLRSVLRLRLPLLTWSVLYTGITATGKLKAGTLTRAALEQAVATLIVKREHRRRHPRRGVRLPIVEGLSLALDIDTLEEARQMGGDVNSRSA